MLMQFVFRSPGYSGVLLEASVLGAHCSNLCYACENDHLQASDKVPNDANMCIVSDCLCVVVLNIDPRGICCLLAHHFKQRHSSAL
eukprot:3835470-Amphidinium_carterae.2